MTNILSKKQPEKSLLRPLYEKAGRNNTGRVTVRHRGGGAKKLYRLIEFGQQFLNIPGTVSSIEYDPNRTSYIALVRYENNGKAYILCPKDLKVGDRILCAENAPIILGNRLKLKNFSVGSNVYNIELIPGMGGKIVRSAGTSAIVMAQEGKYTNLKMPSGEVRKVLSECFASSGSLSNPENRFKIWRKAGITRLKGWRPSVRGSAMNACDHPHGGGKNKQPIGMHPKTAWGKPALGVKTRKNKWTDKLIMERRKKK